MKDHHFHDHYRYVHTTVPDPHHYSSGKKLDKPLCTRQNRCAWIVFIVAGVLCLAALIIILLSVFYQDVPNHAMLYCGIALFFVTIVVAILAIVMVNQKAPSHSRVLRLRDKDRRQRMVEEEEMRVQGHADNSMAYPTHTITDDVYWAPSSHSPRHDADYANNRRDSIDRSVASSSRGPNYRTQPGIVVRTLDKHTKKQPITVVNENGPNDKYSRLSDNQEEWRHRQQDVTYHNNAVHTSADKDKSQHRHDRFNDHYPSYQQHSGQTAGPDEPKGNGSADAFPERSTVI